VKLVKNKKMSRIGKKPISIPTGVEISIKENVITVKGKKGELTQEIDPTTVTVKIEENIIEVSRLNESKDARSKHGLYRSLIANMIEGVSNGFSKSLEIRGVGYRGSMKGNVLEMNLGFSHPISFEAPAGIEIKFEEKSQNNLTISGIDKQLVGQVAANIREYRKPEPYKGKGIRYTDEYVAIKAGKSASK